MHGQTTITFDLARRRAQELLEEAAREHRNAAARAARGHRPSTIAAALATLGSALVRIGTRLSDAATSAPLAEPVQ